MTAGPRVVQEAGRAAFPGFRLRVLERTPSTQDVVRAAARAGAEAGFCCVARAQSAGRGRQGRAWEAPPGTGLLVSVLVRVPGGVVGGVPLVGGLAVCDAVEGLGVGRGVVGLKWPNDVVVGGRKLAGVLAEVEAAARRGESSPRAAGIPAPPGASPAGGDSGGRSGTSPHGTRAAEGGEIPVALGIGLNLTVREFPQAVPGISLHELLGRDAPWEEALAALLPALAGRLAELESGGIPATVAAWRTRAVGLGGEVEAHTPGGVIRGRAVDVAEDGALLLDTPSGLTRLVAGDVHLVAPPTARDVSR